MGFISRKVLPACGNMCVCCPALRPSSRQPVKRYKKLLGEILPKAPNGPPNERKIIKLCEYAARNPTRIPKIAKFLEQRCYKELRSDHSSSIRIITETYSKLLCICKEQMVYFASSLLNVIDELLDDKRQDDLMIVGCKTLTKFIYSQADSTYAHSIEDSVSSVCKLALMEGEQYSERCLRAASLECLSAMVWYMSTFSHIFADFDEIVYVCLDNYETDDALLDDPGDAQDTNQNWVEVVRSDARGGSSLGCDASPPKLFLRPPCEIKDSSNMTREEMETPRIWAQICIQKITDMAKESTTMRRILDPMFTYFDNRNQWEPRQGLAIVVLSDVLHLVKNSGNVQVILGYIVRHLDHKNIVHDPRVKSDIIQICTCLIQQLKLQNGVADIGVISDLCRHLKKSLQATAELAGQQEANWNTLLQNSIEDCLLEISKGINDAKPLVDMMTITLEELPAITVVSRATIGSLLILAHIVSFSYVHSHSLDFPETLLLQLLKAMLHPDVETRIGAHRIFSVLIVRTSTGLKHEHSYFKPEYLYEPKPWQSRTASAFVSATALLEKLRKEKESGNMEKGPNDMHADGKEREITDEDWKHARARKNSPNLYKFSCSIMDRGVCSSSSSETDPKIAVLSDDQIAMALSAFWIQANQPDNLPYNFEAISHSFSLTVLSARLKNLNHQNVLRMFQLPLSIRNAALDIDGVISPSHQRSLFTMSVQMLIFGGKTYHVPELCNSLKTLMPTNCDPFLSIGEDMQLYVKPQMDLDEYGSDEDKLAALSSFAHFRKAVVEFDQVALASLVQCLSKLTDFDNESLVKELSKTFSPDDGLLFGPYTALDWFYNPDAAHSDESFSFDEESSENASVDGGIVRESPISDLPQFVSKTNSQVISVGQLLESALQVAGQVAGTTVSTSPLPYGAMATQCEALGMGNRKKLSTWLGCNNDQPSDLQLDKLPEVKNMKVNGYRPEKEGFVTDSWLTVRLPPASPFDNFLKAARY